MADSNTEYKQTMRSFMSFVLIAGGIIFLFMAGYRAANYKEVEAEVLQTSTVNSGDEIRHYIRISYEYEGKSHKAKLRVHGSNAHKTIGSHIKVLCDPKKPQNVYTADSAFTMPFLSVIAGLVLMLFNRKKE